MNDEQVEIVARAIQACELGNNPSLARLYAHAAIAAYRPLVIEECYQRGRAEGCAEMAQYIRDNPPSAVGNLEGREAEIATLASTHQLIAAGADVFASREFKKLTVEQQFAEPISTALRSMKEPSDG